MSTHFVSLTDISTNDILNTSASVRLGLIDLDNNVPLTEALFYILLALKTPNHGYGIIQDVSEMTGGRVVLGPGTLYGAINSMLSKGWISLYSEDKESRKKKEYLITSVGKEVFKSEVIRLQELLENAKMMDEEERGKGKHDKV